MSQRTNDEWRHDLLGTGMSQAAALADLRALLLRAALFALSRHRGAGRASLVSLAEDAAQDALVSVLERLGEFRGESRFTTWAYTFAVKSALVAARRERWKNMALAPLLDGARTAAVLQHLPGPPATPARAALRAEALATIGKVIEEDLTERQRQVLHALAFSGVPLDEVVRHLGSNRNAVYKLVHDARRRLKAGLEARGFRIGEILDLFTSPG
jgi:RNA polymerase sigma-70 factor (ECF subfamily)